MNTNNKASWDSMLSIAEDLQQEYYELLPEWTVYKQDEYKYLKQNIGFALFGPLQESQDPNNPERTNFITNTSSDNTSMFDKFSYKPELQDIINSIFEQIRVQGEGGVDADSIYYGIIFNVTLSSKDGSTLNSFDSSKSKEDNKVKKLDSSADKKVDKSEKLDSSADKKVDKSEKLDSSADKKVDKSEKLDSSADKKVDKSEKLDSSADKKVDKSEINIQFTPVFKIKKLNVTKKQTLKLNRSESWYVTWYIDINGRVYKSWADYKESNTLPKCTMVLPKDGFYQPNPKYEITEEFSKVWVEVLDSPACSTANTVLGAIDKASTVVGIVGLGLGIATLFTPLAPVAVGAMAASGTTGAWTVGRSTQNLIDKAVHKESLKDRSAFCSWLGIGGGVAGLAAAGGSHIISKAVEKGNTINKFVKGAYNTLLVSNISINGVGVMYQGYCLYEKYMQGEEVTTLDVVSFGTHVLFFGNAVINFQTAGDLIESTQGKVLNDYRSNLRSKRLRKQYNRAKRNAATNNTDKVSENAEVIKYINNKKSFHTHTHTQQVNPNFSDIQTRNCVSFADGKILFNGIAFLDPMIFVELLLSSLRNEGNPSENRFSSCDKNDYTPTLYKLKDLLINLLSNYNLEKRNEDAYKFDIDDFDETIQDMKYMDNATDIFTLIFKLATALAEIGQIDSTFLADAIFFLWSYVKQNLRRICINISSFVNSRKIQKKIINIIIALFDELDEVVKRLLPAFSKYLKEKLMF